VNLPATLRGYRESTILARTDGYVSAWYKDIGATVKHGELLAELSAPEHEQELMQARAARERTQSRAALARASLERWEMQLQTHVVSRQAVEERRSELQQAEADLAAAGANVQRLEHLFGLQRIVAPFDGVILRRSVDVGTLVTSGARELFSLSQTGRLRLTIWIPQVFASDVRPGQPVEVTLEELSGRTFGGTIDTVAGGIDAATRARQVEIVVPNTEGLLLPGAYAQVSLGLTRSVNALVLPPNTLIVDGDGTKVLLVDAERRLALRAVKLGRDLAKEIEILEGLTTADEVVVSPSDLLQEGERVTVQPRA